MRSYLIITPLITELVMIVAAPTMNKASGESVKRIRQMGYTVRPEHLWVIHLPKMDEQAAQYGEFEVLGVHTDRYKSGYFADLDKELGLGEEPGQPAANA
jgi:hypothetical protein